MRLNEVSIGTSPIADDRIRIYGEVAYDDLTLRTEVYWFDLPKACEEFLSNSGNPWLVCLIPLAVTLGEPLRICVPVDRVLFENVQELMRIWKCWYPHLQVVPIEANLVDAVDQEAPKTAAFFSGGVDSFFTVLWHGQSDSTTRTRIDELLSVWGFDVPLDNPDAFRRMHGVLERAASDLGKKLIDVATNLRETRWRQADWGFLSHNCALASIGLALEKRYSKVLIASTGGYRDLLPWGSHVLTDPLLSTSRTKIVHDGAAFSLTEKAGVVVRSEVALRSLRVCWRSRSDRNCCACNKCYRTMITLELLGALEHCITFSQRTLDLATIKRIYSPKHYDVDYYREIQILAVRKGRVDIAKAVERSLKNSGWISKFLRIMGSVQKKRCGRRWAPALERALLKHCVI